MNKMYIREEKKKPTNKRDFIIKRVQNKFEKITRDHCCCIYTYINQFLCDIVSFSFSFFNLFPIYHT